MLAVLVTGRGRLLEIDERLLLLAERTPGARQIDHHRSVVCVEAQRELELPARLLDPAALEQRQAEVVVEQRMLGLELETGLEVFDRLGEIAESLKLSPAVVVRQQVGSVLLERLRVGFDRRL